MNVHTTKDRLALAALFVLAGVGLGNLLSPLVGTALANVGQVVNISDHSASAYFAKVTSAGELKTKRGSSGGTVTCATSSGIVGGITSMSTSSSFLHATTIVEPAASLKGP